MGDPEQPLRASAYRFARQTRRFTVFPYAASVAMPVRALVVIATLLLLLVGCQPDPCENAVPAAKGRGGDALLSVPVIGQRYSPGRASFPVECAGVLVLNANDYADTLAAGRVHVRNGALHATGLPNGPADVIVGGERFFPVKHAGVRLRSGRNRLGSRLFMYRWDAPFHASGWVEVEFRPGSTGDDIRPIYEVYDHVEVHDMGPSYRLRFTSESPLTADVRLLRLCRRLLASPHVRSARPIVDFNLMYPAGTAQ